MPAELSRVWAGAHSAHLLQVRQGGDEEAAKQMYEGYENLVADNIADDVLYVATRCASPLRRLVV